LHFAQSFFILPCGQPLHPVQLFFSFPCGQGLHSEQLRFSLPWKQGLHAAQSYFTLPCEHRFCTMSRQNGFADTPARTSQVIANRAPRVVPAPRASWESIFSDGRHGTNNFYYASQQRPLSQIRPVFPGSTLPRTQCGSARLARWSRASARA